MDQATVRDDYDDAEPVDLPLAPPTCCCCCCCCCCTLAVPEVLTANKLGNRTADAYLGAGAPGPWPALLAYGAGALIANAIAFPVAFMVGAPLLLLTAGVFPALVVFALLIVAPIQASTISGRFGRPAIGALWGLVVAVAVIGNVAAIGIVVFLIMVVPEPDETFLEWLAWALPAVVWLAATTWLSIAGVRAYLRRPRPPATPRPPRDPPLEYTTGSPPPAPGRVQPRSGGRRP